MGMTLPRTGLCEYRVMVGRDWLGYNQHMNVAYYLKAFDDAGEGLTVVIGMGADYTRRTGNSWVALASHITFQNEAGGARQSRTSAYRPGESCTACCGRALHQPCATHARRLSHAPHQVRARSKPCA